jgi:hypothetical protein
VEVIECLTKISALAFYEGNHDHRRRRLKPRQRALLDIKRKLNKRILFKTIGTQPLLSFVLSRFVGNINYQLIAAVLRLMTHLIGQLRIFSGCCTREITNMMKFLQQLLNHQMRKYISNSRNTCTRSDHEIHDQDSDVGTSSPDVRDHELTVDIIRTIVEFTGTFECYLKPATLKLWCKYFQGDTIIDFRSHPWSHDNNIIYPFYLMFILYAEAWPYEYESPFNFEDVCVIYILKSNIILYVM